jgi:N-acetylneuraminic acid mutarotase
MHFFVSAQMSSELVRPLSPPQIAVWKSVPVRSSPESIPKQRSLHVGVCIGDSFYIFGGYDGATRLNDLHRFDFVTSCWSLVVPSNGISPSPRDRLAAISHRDCIYIWGGYDGSNRVNDLWKFDIGRNNWSSVESVGGTCPSPRHSHNAVEWDGKIFILFGYDGNYRSDICEFNIARKTWVTIQARGQIPRARYRSASVVYRDCIYTFGGHDGTRHLDDLNCFNLITNTWTAIDPIVPISSMGPYSFRTSPNSSTPPSNRDSHSAVVHGDSIFIFGGSTGMARNDLYEYRVDLNCWIELMSHTNSPVNSSNAVGGSPTATATVLSPAATIPDPPTGTVSTGVSAEARFCHVACVYKDCMYIHAGYDGQSRLNDFKSYSFIDNILIELPPPTILADLKSYINNPRNSDIKFELDSGEIFFGHKLILSRSNFFQAMFETAMKESAEDIIHISDVSASNFFSLISYLYSDEMDLTYESAIEMFIVADRFGIDRLKRICEQSILSQISPTNSCHIFLLADRHNATMLRKKSLEFILRHYDSVVKTEAFEGLARTNIELALELIRQR